jgi:hypothetical protein
MRGRRIYDRVKFRVKMPMTGQGFDVMLPSDFGSSFLRRELKKIWMRRCSNVMGTVFLPKIL